MVILWHPYVYAEMLAAKISHVLYVKVSRISQSVFVARGFDVPNSDRDKERDFKHLYIVDSFGGWDEELHCPFESSCPGLTMRSSCRTR